MRRRRYMGIGIAVLGVLLLLSLADESAAGAHLVYERLGYQSGVERLVDNFLANVAGDDGLSGRFANTDMGKLRGQLINQMCEATDGPCAYESQSMREINAGSGITEAEFAVITGHFAGALEQTRVSASDKAAVMEAFSAMQGDIVGQ